jgi:predicted phage terminase large subunit-like protein
VNLLVPKILIQKLAAQAQAEARRNFWAFRRYMRPGMLWGWWAEQVAVELQHFYLDLVAGKRPQLALMAPPQHGKSWAATDFIAWVAGKNPNLKTIFASYSDDLGMRTNLDLQRMLMSPAYRSTFPNTRMGVHGWQCNTSLIEFARHSGSFRNTTTGGSINGMELHLGVIDDPIRGRADAQSKGNRDKVWAWFTDDWGARFANEAGMLIIVTRWHVDDLVGRLMEKAGDDLKVLAYPAIAERDEEHRSKGDALFPELKPLDFLLARKKVMSEASWESEYQQKPYLVGGGAIPIEKITVVPYFDRQSVIRSVRYFDKSSGVEDGAYTAGALMHKMGDGTFVISHMARGRWGALEREQKIKLLADADAKLFTSYEVGVEQEPGSGGKESAEATVRNLAGKVAFADRVTGSKQVRAEPFVAQCQNGNVRLVAGGWVQAFYDEAEAWPASRCKDQVDACSGAFNRLTQGYGYDTQYRGFQDW